MYCKRKQNATYILVTGFPVTFISDLERGKPTAEIEKTIQLINVLGLDLLVERRG